MVFGRRHYRSGRWVAALLLAAYAPIALLGYGLHSVLSCDHCGNGSEIAAADKHDCCCCHQHADHAPAVVRSTNCVQMSCDPGAHDCTICQFLAQAQSPAVACEAPKASAPLASLLVVGRPLLFAVVCDTHFARGPPALA